MPGKADEEGIPGRIWTEENDARRRLGGAGTEGLPSVSTSLQSPARRAQPTTLGAAFDPRRNALNAIRLLLALLVIVWHSFPLSGHEVPFAPLRQVLGRFSVDGFFAISGYLIVASWVRTPKWWPFLRARVLRIFPAFWVSLIVTAFVIAPLSLVARGAPLDGAFWSGAVRYVVNNAGLWVNHFGIAGTPLEVPYPGAWNGSMWTLFWEFLCYLGVLALGLAGLFRRRLVVPALFGLALLGVLATSYGPIGNFWLSRGSQFGVMFLAGTLIYQYADRIPLSRRWIVAALVLLVGSAWLPDYRLVAALPIAYLMIALGALGTHPRLQVRNDFSYGTYIFAFPLQQLLATLGVASLGVPLFCLAGIAVTLPVAAASWFWIEKPALRLKKIRRPVTAQEIAVAEGTHRS